MSLNNTENTFIAPEVLDAAAKEFVTSAAATDDYVEVTENEQTPTESSAMADAALAQESGNLYENLAGIADIDDSLNISSYSLDDAERYAEHLGTLNHIELNYVLNNLTKTKKEADELSTIIDAIGSMDMPDGTNRKMMQANVLAHSGIDSNIDVFREENAAARAKLEFLISKTNEALEAYKDVPPTTQFFSQQMVEILDKKIARLNPADPQYKRKLNQYQTTKKAFTYRTDFTYIHDYITKTFSNKRTRRTFNKTVAETTNKRPFYLSDLRKSFTPTQLGLATEFLVSVFHLTAVQIYALHFVFGRIVKNEVASGGDNYVKVFILNILDYLKDGYDYIDPINTNPTIEHTEEAVTDPATPERLLMGSIREVINRFAI